MTNGGNYSGTISLGDLDMWSFTANTGDNINLRLGTTGFDGELQLFGPNGALLKPSRHDTDELIDFTRDQQRHLYRAGQQFDYLNGLTGTYALHLAQIPEAFIVPAGDPGGSATNGGSYTGTITLGDLDIWAFTACKGDLISLQLNTTNFYGRLQLYGSKGALLKTVRTAGCLTSPTRRQTAVPSPCWSAVLII